MRRDTKGIGIVRVIDVYAGPGGELRFADVESDKSLDYLECAFVKNSYCGPSCAAKYEVEGVVHCQRGIMIGHLQGQLEEGEEN